MMEESCMEDYIGGLCDAIESHGVGSQICFIFLLLRVYSESIKDAFHGVDRESFGMSNRAYLLE